MVNIKNGKPDYAQAKQIVAEVSKIDTMLKQIIDAEASQKSAVKKAVNAILGEKVRSTLETLDIEQINKDKQGIKVSLLRSKGINSIWDVLNMPMQKLYNVQGIGQQSAFKIKKIAEKIEKDVRKSTFIRISAESRSAEDTLLIRVLFVLTNTISIRKSCREIYKGSHNEIFKHLAIAKRAKNGLSWFFTFKNQKNIALNSLDVLEGLLNGEYGSSCRELIFCYNNIISADENQCWDDFERNSPAYYSVLESIDQGNVKKDKVLNGIPSQLAQQIDACQLDLSQLKVSLRSYQNFGTKYIVMQKKVLLGDEMGLGKTVQAIAAMVHLKANENTHFMVVCPASVLVNWCREIEKHSALRAYKIHGDYEEALNLWLQNGDVAVTTYETINKLELPQQFNIGMVIADEAHYVKNPEAIRTRSLNKLLQKTERILFMTGTPIENNVDEMCFLISCLQPEIAKELESIKFMSTAVQFREKLAPVYLRRTRDDVLQELPELIEKEEWSDLSAQESSAYYDAVMSENFMAMRQVSWHIDNISQSVKAQRLIELCDKAQEENRKIIVFTFFRDTIAKVCDALGSRCLQPITGSISPAKRQEIIDLFTKAENGTVLVCQVQAGGTGLNIQAASMIIFCEPQLKPSIENQAISRAYRMGQVRNVLVHRLLCEDCVDERVMEILARKQDIFDSFADESVVGVENLKQNEELILENNIIKLEKERLQNSSTENKLSNESMPETEALKN